MPKLTEATPKYRCHKASGPVIVTIQGHDFYLGPCNTKASKVEYDRVISEWLAAGRRLPGLNGENNDLTVVEVLARHKVFATQHYRRGTARTVEWDNILTAIEPLKRLYGRTLVREFGPLALKAIQQDRISKGLSRGVINARVGRIKRFFRWAVSEQLAPPSLAVALQTVMGLQRTQRGQTGVPRVKGSAWHASHLASRGTPDGEANYGEDDSDHARGSKHALGPSSQAICDPDRTRADTHLAQDKCGGK